MYFHYPVPVLYLQTGVLAPSILQTPRFGCKGSTDSQSIKYKLVITVKDAGPATKIFRRKKDTLLPKNSKVSDKKFRKLWRKSSYVP